MTWLVELPDADGQPMLINLDEPVFVQADGDRSSILTTPLGPCAVGLGYDALCERLRLNPADRMTPPALLRVRRRMLGRRPAKRDRRVPRLAAVTATLPAAPARFTSYVDAVPRWILGENDKLGDCTCVGPANAILALTTAAGAPRRLPDADIVAFYSAVSGYRPSDPSSDAGAMIEDVLAAWHSHGFDADTLDGYASIDPADHERVKQAIAFLGPVDLGLNLPSGWLRASVWDVSTAGADIAGGHCVCAVGYDAEGLQIVSWGQVFTLTWAGWDRAVDEAHALLSRDALTKAGRDPAGVDWTALEGFMTIIREAA